MRVTVGVVVWVAVGGGGMDGTAGVAAKVAAGHTARAEQEARGVAVSNHRYASRK